MYELTKVLPVDNWYSFAKLWDLKFLSYENPQDNASIQAQRSRLRDNPTNRSHHLWYENIHGSIWSLQEKDKYVIKGYFDRTLFSNDVFESKT